MTFRRREGEGMNPFDDPKTEELFRAILALGTVEECKKFFSDACTIQEISEITRRFTVAKMLYEGKVYTEIAEATGASTATISRVKKCLDYGEGGYATVLERLAATEK